LSAILKSFAEWWFQHSQDLLSGIENGGSGVLLGSFLSDIVVYVQIVSVIATHCHTDFMY